MIMVVFKWPNVELSVKVKAFYKNSTRDAVCGWKAISRGRIGKSIMMKVELKSVK